MQHPDLHTISVVSPQARAYSWVERWLRAATEFARSRNTAALIDSTRYLGLKKAHREACAKHARFASLAYFLDAQSRCGAVIYPAGVRGVPRQTFLLGVCNLPLTGYSSIALSGRRPSCLTLSPSLSLSDGCCFCCSSRRLCIRRFDPFQ